MLRQQSSGKTRTAKLTWKASSSHVAGYNVYRSEVSGQKYKKINSSLVQGLTYTDNTVLSGVTYYYVTRAVDDQGHESADSNETIVSIP
jgi:fibronectin type 3 domain-containing protein